MMRLTLRTMLAYLDDILDPTDALELGKKIEESKFASDLVHRIRTSMRRLRLDAPKLDGKGMGLDPNTVAEYLDNTLPADRVPDFEKVCLESDRHLAEVASCHQILTLVLGEPAQVPTTLRERIYRINVAPIDERMSRRGESGHLAESHKVDSAEPVPPPKSAAIARSVAPPLTSEPAIPKSELPDYMQPSGVRAFPIVLAFLGAFAIVGGGWWLFNRERQEVALNNSNAAANSTDSNSTNSNTSKRNAQMPVRDGSQTSDAMDDDGGDDSKGGDEAANGTENANGPAEPPVKDTVKDTVKETTDDQGEPSNVEKAATEVTDNAANNAAANPVEPIRPRVKTPSLPAESKMPHDLGRLVSDEHVLAHIDPETGLWQRMTRGTTLTAGDRLVVLPTYRPIISLITGVQMMCVGEMSMHLDVDQASDMPLAVVDYGQAVIGTAGQPGAKLRLQLADQLGTATFDDVDSELAIEVRKFLPPGRDPAKDEVVNVVRLYATSGSIVWEPAAGEAVSITVGNAWTSVTGEAPQLAPSDSAPSWLLAKNLAKTDRDASRELEGYLGSDKSLKLLLEERTTFRKVEVRSLAARCLGSLDEFDGLLREINDDRQRSYWQPAVDSLREALIRSPASMEKLRATLDRERPEDAKTLYRLLCDFGPDDFVETGAKQLIAYLDHSALDVRVLAYETLRRITGSTHMYQPELPAERRKRQINVWNERLKEGLVTYRNLPAPLPDRKPAAKPAEEAPNGNLP